MRRALDGSRWGPVFLTALALGLWRGEVLGLRWADIDIDTRTVHVQQAVQNVKPNR